MSIAHLYPVNETPVPTTAPGAGTPGRATMTVSEAAEVLGISRSTAYELVHAGALPALRLGRRIVVPRHALEELLYSARPNKPTLSPQLITAVS